MRLLDSITFYRGEKTEIPCRRGKVEIYTHTVCLHRYAPHKDVSVNDGPHIRRWSHN